MCLRFHVLQCNNIVSNSFSTNNLVSLFSNNSPRFQIIVLNCDRMNNLVTLFLCFVVSSASISGARRSTFPFQEGIYSRWRSVVWSMAFSKTIHIRILCSCSGLYFVFFQSFSPCFLFFILLFFFMFLFFNITAVKFLVFTILNVDVFFLRYLFMLF